MKSNLFSLKEDLTIIQIDLGGIFLENSHNNASFICHHWGV